MITSLLDFGDAIRIVKKGGRVARMNWNGKGMFIFLQTGSKHFINDKGESLVGGVDPELFETGHDGTSTRMPCVCMNAADGSTVTGWLASQTDMLAHDWVIAA